MKIKNVNSAEETGAEIKSIDEILGGMTLPNVKEGHKAGFVNIVGNPNVGKSTLMNDLVGERVSIITSKAQTTRHRIMGIVNTPDYQIVFSDTPGCLSRNISCRNQCLSFRKAH